MLRKVSAALEARRAMRAMDRMETRLDASELDRAIAHWERAHRAAPNNAEIRRFFAQALITRAEARRTADDARRGLALLDGLPRDDRGAEFLRTIGTAELAVIVGDVEMLHRGLALCRALRDRPGTLAPIVGECLTSEINAHRALSALTREPRHERRARELLAQLVTYAPELARDMEGDFVGGKGP